MIHFDGLAGALRGSAFPPPAHRLSFSCCSGGSCSPPPAGAATAAAVRPKKARNEYFGKFVSWEEQRHEYAREWKKRTGGKVVGYFCTYVPEEILYAADVLPVRILGSHEPQDVTEPHIFGMFCPFCRDCLAQGLKGRYEYLDGIMISQSCLHIRQTFTSWKKHVPVSWSYYLPMPNHVQSATSHPYLRGELERFKASLEEWTGVPLTEERLRRGIGIMNRSRDLQARVFDLRKADDPPLTGLEAMEMVVAAQVTDKREHAEEMQRVLGLLPERRMDRQTGTRLMIVGSEDDDSDFIQMVENCGATFVTDDHCTGTRYFLEQVGEGTDPLQAIADRYIARPPCPSKDWPERRRVEHILGLARDYRARGAILIQQKFCDPHECDIPPLKAALEQAGIPTLFLEFDVTVPLGQFRVRVEAFLEMISGEDLF